MDDKEQNPPTIDSYSSDNGELPIIDEQDAREMAKLGIKQRLRRNFGWLSILGFSCICMVTWEGQLVVFIYGLENGGPTGLIIGFFVVMAGYALVVASMAELVSMWPTSSGQYYWTYALSNHRWAPFLSYIVGWQTVVAWQAAAASVTYLAATLIQGLAVLNYRNYHYHLWHGTLIMYAIILVSVISNTFLAKWLPRIEYGALTVHIVGFIAVIVVVTVMSPHKADNHKVWDTFINNGGWSSPGLSFWVGLQGIVLAWLGADGAIHMSEEIRNASSALPWSLMGSIAINGTLGFSILLAVLYCGGNLQSAISSPTQYPIEAIFTYASRSKAGGTGLTCILILANLFSSISASAAANRELWAFARDNGLPGAKWLRRVHPGSKLPLWAIAATYLVTALLALINIGSVIAFNAILSLTVAGYVSSYLLPLILHFYRRITTDPNANSNANANANANPTQSPLPLIYGPFKLGPTFGPAANLIGFLWCVLIVFWSFWPRVSGPTVGEMNWSCLAYGAVTILAMVFWVVDGRGRYVGPVRELARVDESAPAAENDIDGVGAGGDIFSGRKDMILDLEV